MGRLIDADKLLEETRRDRDYARKNGFLDMYYERQALIDRIKSQPTAYDVDKVVKIIEKCDELGLKPSGSIFKRTPKEIEDIYNIYKDLLDRNPDQNAYNKKPQEVLKILKLCIKNNIKITGTLYRKTSEELESTINYIKQYYSDEYLTPQIIIYDKNHIEKIFNYLSGKKILHTIIKSSGILRLTLEELIDREIYIRMINQDLVVGETFNPVMGWSKKEYEKRKKELNKNK